MCHAHDRLNEERKQVGSWTVGREKEEKNVGPGPRKRKREQGKRGSQLRAGK